MMHEFYDPLLHLNENFPLLVETSPIFKHSFEAHFIFLNTDQSKIIYQYDFKNTHDFSDFKYKNLHDSANVILKKKRVNYRIWEGPDFEELGFSAEKGKWLAISVYHPLAEGLDDYVTILLLCLEKDFLVSEIDNYLNEEYLFQTCLHVNMVLNNYEKLFPTIDTFVEMLAKKDIFMPHHMTNVANLCIKTASRLELSKYQTSILHIAALMHDVGKMNIPDKILNKHGCFDESEYKIIKTHCTKGEEIARTAFYGMSLLNDIPKIIRHHHENFDGSGYPDGLSGEDIPYLSRIISVADTVDTLLSSTSYKSHIERTQLIKTLTKNKGSQFDPRIVDVMIEIIKDNEMLDAASFINQNQFIPKAVLSFFYSDKTDPLSLSGNLIVDNSGAKFIAHSEDEIISSFDPQFIYKSTFSFFDQRIMYEYNTKISLIKDNQFFLKNIIYMPADKYFSIAWDSTIYIRKSPTELFGANIITLGVDMIIFESKDIDAQYLIEHFNEPLKVHLDEKLEDLELNMNTDLKIVKYYRNDASTVFICKYENLSALQRDIILKLLFRKQVLLRRAKSESIKSLD